MSQLNQKRRQSSFSQEIAQVSRNLRHNRTIDRLRRSTQNVQRSIHRLFDYYNNLSEEEKELCDAFLDYFAICPICKEKNHQTYLVRFYFDNNPEKSNLRKQLIKLLDKIKNFNKKTIVGIPCCKCHEKLFSSKISEEDEDLPIRNPQLTELRRIIINFHGLSDEEILAQRRQYVEDFGI